MQFYVMPLPGRGWGWGREESWRDRNKRKNISYLIQHQQHALRYPFFIFKSLLLLTWIVHTHMCTLWTNKKRDENWWKLKENFTFLWMNRMWRKVIVWIIIITNHCVVVEPLKLLDRRKRFYRAIVQHTLSSLTSSNTHNDHPGRMYSHFFCLHSINRFLSVPQNSSRYTFQLVTHTRCGHWPIAKGIYWLLLLLLRFETQSGIKFYMDRTSVSLWLKNYQIS